MKYTYYKFADFYVYRFDGTYWSHYVYPCIEIEYIGWTHNYTFAGKLGDDHPVKTSLIPITEEEAFTYILVNS